MDDEAPLLGRGLCERRAVTGSVWGKTLLRSAFPAVSIHRVPVLKTNAQEKSEHFGRRPKTASILSTHVPKDCTATFVAVQSSDIADVRYLAPSHGRRMLRLSSQQQN